MYQVTLPNPIYIKLHFLQGLHALSPNEILSNESHNLPGRWCPSIPPYITMAGHMCRFHPEICNPLLTSNGSQICLAARPDLAMGKHGREAINKRVRVLEELYT